MTLTLVTFHAHPDDEAIHTGGTMARAAAAGHRVVLVVATRGELGEQPGSPGANGAELAARRVDETMAAAEILGVRRVEFLGYHDSGMAGEPTNDDPACFARAGVDDAAARLAAILAEEHADVLTVYDEHGGYGHPDHVQVHRVGHRAAAAHPVALYEATMNRDHLRRLMAAHVDAFEELPEDERPDLAELETLGMPEQEITTTVDVRAFADRKRAAMAAHASQIGPESFFLAMPDEAFREAFGWEWFIHRPAAGDADGDLLAHLD